MRAHAGLYALVCATAVLAGVFRSAVSLVVLVVEGTRSVNFLFGIILAVVVANLTAGVFDRDGVYESEIEHDHSVAFLHAEPPPALEARTADAVMAAPVVALPRVAPLRAVLAALRSTAHHGFPVVDNSDEEALWPQGGNGAAAGVTGRVVGLVLRSQLLVLVEELCASVLLFLFFFAWPFVHNLRV
jgi:chloride channel 7